MNMCTGPFCRFAYDLGWLKLDRTTQTLQNCSAYFFKVGFDTGAISVLLGTVTMRDYLTAYPVIGAHMRQNYRRLQ